MHLLCQETAVDVGRMQVVLEFLVGGGNPVTVEHVRLTKRWATLIFQKVHEETAIWLLEVTRPLNGPRWAPFHCGFITHLRPSSLSWEDS